MFIDLKPSLLIISLLLGLQNKLCWNS